MTNINAVVDQLRQEGIIRVRFDTFLNLFGVDPDELCEYISEHPDELKIILSGSSEKFGQ
jgi:hypothetical protein